LDKHYNTIYINYFILFMPDSDGLNGIGCGEFNSAQTEGFSPLTSMFIARLIWLEQVVIMASSG
jgi:hypothetical protein